MPDFIFTITDDGATSVIEFDPLFPTFILLVILAFMGYGVFLFIRDEGENDRQNGISLFVPTFLAGMAVLPGMYSSSIKISQFSIVEEQGFYWALGTFAIDLRGVKQVTIEKEYMRDGVKVWRPKGTFDTETQEYTYWRFESENGRVQSHSPGYLWAYGTRHIKEKFKQRGIKIADQ